MAQKIKKGDQVVVLSGKDKGRTGEVTKAVRDTASDAGPITTGDWIGLVRGDGVVSVSGTLEGASLALLDLLVEPGREILTVVTGADAPRRRQDRVGGAVDVVLGGGGVRDRDPDQALLVPGRGADPARPVALDLGDDLVGG